MSWQISDRGNRLGKPCRYIDVWFATRAEARAELQELLKPYPPTSIWRKRLIVTRVSPRAVLNNYRWTWEREFEAQQRDAFRSRMAQYKRWRKRVDELEAAS